MKEGHVSFSEEQARAELRRVWLDYCQTAGDQSVEAFLALASTLLSDAQERFDGLVFYDVGMWLDTPDVRAKVWDWLGGVADGASPDRRVLLEISILNIIPEEPADLEMVRWLLDWLLIPARAWAVVSAYQEHQQVLHSHLEEWVRGRESGLVARSQQ